MKEQFERFKERGLNTLTSTNARIGLGLAAVMGAGVFGIGVSVDRPIESGAGDTRAEWIAAGAINGVTELRDVADEMILPGAFNAGIATETVAYTAALAFSLACRRPDGQE